jgi:hypothetical protein
LCKGEGRDNLVVFWAAGGENAGYGETATGDFDSITGLLA